MTEQTNNNCTWDESFWPKAGTVIHAGPMPADLEDLWEKYPEQASVFVANALTNEPPRLIVELREGNLLIDCYAWTVGDDTIAVTKPLGESLMEAVHHHSCGQIRSQSQRDDVAKNLAALEALEATIQECKKTLEDELATYDARQAAIAGDQAMAALDGKEVG